MGKTKAYFIVALMVAVGCGEDDPPPAAAAKGGGKKSAAADAESGAPAKRAAGAGAGKEKKSAALRTYAKVADEDRREFRERDFLPDSTGAENRDPFRSYVVTQPGLASKAAETAMLTASDVCKPANSRASEYSLRDLRLIGLILRGTRSYAQFRDPSGFGHIVRRRDCLGKEKAIVEAITAGYVRLEVIPEAPPGGKTPEPEKREIALYPTELQLTEDITSQGGGEGEGGQ